MIILKKSTDTQKQNDQHANRKVILPSTLRYNVEWQFDNGNETEVISVSCTYKENEYQNTCGNIVCYMGESRKFLQGGPDVFV